MSDDLKYINKGIMQKNGKPYLPITHESLVVDNDGVSIDKKYITKAYVRGLASEYYVEQYVDEYVTYHLAPIKDAIWNEDTGLLKRTGDLEAAIEEGGVVYESIKANKEAIEAENERAVLAEEELNNAILKESEDRIEADEILDSKILDEENRAVAKETELDNKIDNSKELIDILNGDVNTAGSVANTVNIETQRAIEAENSLRENIKENRSLIDILNGSTTTEGSVKKQLKDTVDSFNVVALKLCSRITANKKSIDILNGEKEVKGSIKNEVSKVIGFAPDNLNTLEKIAKAMQSNQKEYEDYVKEYVAQAQLGGNVNLEIFAKAEDVKKKVDKEEGKSLVPDEEIKKLATLENYDDTELRTLIANKAFAIHNHDSDYASKSSEHKHVNKAVLDEITLVRMNTWDDKSNFSGSYNDLTDKPEIPSIEGLATEEFVETRIEDALTQKGESGGEIINMENFATKEYVKEQIDLIELTPGPAGADGKDGVDAEIPNFAFAINMIESAQVASVTTSGVYPNLSITFNIPKCICDSKEDPSIVKPKMWIGYMYFDETGETGFSQLNDINDKMQKEVIDKALTRGGLVEMDPQLLKDYDCGAVEDIPEGGAYICCIYPKECNYDVYIMSNQLSRQYKRFSDLDSEDGSTGYQFCQQGVELVSKIDDITYCQSGGYIATDGSKNILAVRQF